MRHDPRGDARNGLRDAGACSVSSADVMAVDTLSVRGGSGGGTGDELIPLAPAGCNVSYTTSSPRAAEGAGRVVTVDERALDTVLLREALSAAMAAAALAGRRYCGSACTSSARLGVGGAERGGTAGGMPAGRP